jgi:hypothetical protein
MADAIDTSYGRLNCARITDITSAKFDGSGSVGQFTDGASGIVIQHANPMALLQQPLHKRAADEPGSSGHKVCL